MNQEQLNCFLDRIIARIDSWLAEYGQEKAIANFVWYMALFQKGYQANDYLDISQKVVAFLVRERPDFFWIGLYLKMPDKLKYTWEGLEEKTPRKIYEALLRDMIFVANGSEAINWETLKKLLEIWNLTGDNDPKTFLL